MYLDISLGLDTLHFPPPHESPKTIHPFRPLFRMNSIEVQQALTVSIDNGE